MAASSTKRRPIISASILGCNLAKINEEVSHLVDAGIKMVHLDVMDGVFAGDITFGPPVIKNITKPAGVIFDAHLMINNPEHSLQQYIDAGADMITLHVESTDQLASSIKTIKDAGIKAGVALKPQTNLDIVMQIISEIDLILIMSVNPGYGGQKFLDSQIEKIKQARHLIDSQTRDIMLSVDGGINDKNSSKLINLGVDILVAGSFLTGNLNHASSSQKVDTYKQRINHLIVT